MPNRADTPLMESLIGIIWNRLHVKEPAYYPTSDTRTALHYLCQLTGLTHADLAKLCNVSPNYFRMIEGRNGHIPPPLCRILCNISIDHYLNNLAFWFDQREHIENSRKRASKRWGV